MKSFSLLLNGDCTGVEDSWFHFSPTGILPIHNFINGHVDFTEKSVRKLFRDNN